MLLGGSQADGGGGSHGGKEIVKGSCKEQTRSVPGSLSKEGQGGGGKRWGHMASNFVEYGSPAAWTVHDAEAVSPASYLTFPGTVWSGCSNRDDLRQIGV